MGFYKTARHSAAVQYGINRAEKWGFWRRLWLNVKIGAGVAFGLWIAWLVVTGR